MYDQPIPYYDKIYLQIKDYRQEVEYLINTVESYGDYSHKELLDVACGTGEHLRYLKKHLHAEGIDAGAEFVRIAEPGAGNLHRRHARLCDRKEI
jgi:ubiquinone/menaquinone biosynthesis C-methylase UbiE